MLRLLKWGGLCLLGVQVLVYHRAGDPPATKTSPLMDRISLDWMESSVVLANSLRMHTICGAV